ncbi:MAG: tetratricopeptide repeat protein [Myxococcales bacterium]
MRIGIRLALTLCALGIAASPVSAAPKKPTGTATAAKKARAAQMRERGLAAVAAGREDEALEDFGLAVEADPNDQVAHHEIGKILFRRGQVPEAIGHFRSAVRLQPKDASAWYNLAFAQRTAQRFPDAAESYRRYAALSPDDPDGYYGLAESLRQSGQARGAVAAYQQYLEKENRPTEQKWVQRAKERITELQPQAEMEQQTAAALSPAAPPTPAATPAAPTAAPTVTAAPTATATGAAAEEPAGTRTIVHGAGDAAPAGKVNVGAPVDPAAKIAEGDSALAAKDFRIALYAYQDAIMADPKNVPARVKAGEVYAKMGHDPEAIEQWNRAIALDPQNGEAQEALAAAFARRELRKPAPQGTTVVTAAPPAPAPAPPAPVPAAAPPARAIASAAPPAPAEDEAGARRHYSAGVALIHDRKYEAAVAELDQAIAMRPAYANALIARGSARISLGRYKDAAQDYSAARAADPALAAPLFGLAEAYRQMGDATKAIELYQAFAQSTAPDAQPDLKAYAKQTADSLSRK